MAVQFFPFYSIPFVEAEISTKQDNGHKGEWIIYRELFLELKESKEDWKVWYSYEMAVHDNFEDYKKVESEIDFIIMSKRGITVLEVKGGTIKIENNSFYCMGSTDWSPITNPFKQASVNKHLLRQQLLKQYSNILICDAVALPGVNMRLEHPKYDDKLLYSGYRKDNIYKNIEAFLNSVYDRHQEKLSRAHSFKFQTITEALSTSISNVLNVNFIDKSIATSSFDTLSWLKVDSLEVLESLSENARLMIQGDPGTGKTTMALAYADKYKHLKGLYICWTHFLRLHNTQRFRERGITIDTMSYFDFVVEHNEDLSVEEAYQLSPESFSIQASKAIAHYLENEGRQYDYIIVDEAQDLFDRNLDVFIDKMCVTGRGLTQGRSLVLYDFKQCFDQENDDLREYAYLLKESYAHYRLQGVKRTVANGEISQLAPKVRELPDLLIDSEYYKNKQQISYKRIGGRKELQKVLRKYMLSIQDNKSSLKAEDIIVLVQSNVLRKNEIVQESLDEIGVTSLEYVDYQMPTLNYSTPIKVKGLEYKHVVLVVDKPNHVSGYEWYIGVTRAIESIEVLKIEF